MPRAVDFFDENIVSLDRGSLIIGKKTTPLGPKGSELEANVDLVWLTRANCSKSESSAISGWFVYGVKLTSDTIFPVLS